MIPDELRGRLTIRVWPDAARYYTLGRDAAYAAVERGEIPSLRLGRRIVVPVGLMLHQLGLDPSGDSEAASPDDSGPAAA